MNFGAGDEDGEEKEWVCDSGADYHMSGDSSNFVDLVDIPMKFYVKQVQGKVAVKQWGTVQLSTEKGEGKKGVLELSEVLFMPGMRVNIFSLRRIREKGACSYKFEGAPQPGIFFPILNRYGRQITSMRESMKARPTLICHRMSGVEEGSGGESEILGGKGVSI